MGDKFIQKTAEGFFPMKSLEDLAFLVLYLLIGMLYLLIGTWQLACASRFELLVSKGLSNP